MAVIALPALAAALGLGYQGKGLFDERKRNKRAYERADALIDHLGETGDTFLTRWQ